MGISGGTNGIAPEIACRGEHLGIRANGGFRISAGVRANDNKVDLHATPTTNVQVGSLDGRVDFKFWPVVQVHFLYRF